MKANETELEIEQELARLRVVRAKAEIRKINAEIANIRAATEFQRVHALHFAADLKGKEAQ